MTLLHVPDLVSRIVTQNRMHAPFVARALAGLTAAELSDLDGYVDHCLSEGATLDGLAADYKLVVDDTLREQVYFWKHGRYRYSRYEDVAGAVYLNDGYMRAYMRGLALTAFFWPNHARMRRWFNGRLPRGGKGRYLEVGPGHGLYFVSALRRGAFERYDGIDISPSSVALTERLLTRGPFGHFEGWRLTVGDFLTAELEAEFDMLVMGEVLEHVEEPRSFLARARAATTESGCVFLTTCINSPAFDHIYLFRSVDELGELAGQAGFAVEDRLVLPYDGTSLEESMQKRLAVNVALVLRHA